jgi:hypothetical protein
MQWKATISILAADYTFENYATISVASLVYAISQGGLIGGAIGFAGISAIESNWNYLGFSLALLVLILLIRLSIEGYIALYKTARDASMFFSLSSRRMLRRDSSLQRDYGREFTPFTAPAQRALNPKHTEEAFEEIVRFLERNQIKARDASFVNSFIGETSAILMRDDESVIAELRIDRTTDSYTLLTEEGEEKDLR